MSSSRKQERRREREIEFQRESEARETERRRVAGLSMFDRVLECGTVSELKDIVLVLARHVGAEWLSEEDIDKVSEARRLDAAVSLEK